jgi:signal transduction histidine kinase/ActR/RegA family two-component response regulator
MPSSLPDEPEAAPPAERILVLAPQGRDAMVIARVLSTQGIAVDTCADLAALVEALRHGAGAAFITEEALSPDPGALRTWIGEQPPWSDFPFMVLVARRHGRRPTDTLSTLVDLGNIVLLERPLNAETLITGARSALRARLRQYDGMRRLLAEAQIRQAELLARADATNAQRALRVAVDAGELGTFHCPLPLGDVDCSARCREHFGLPPDGRLDLGQIERAIHPEDTAAVRTVFFGGLSTSESREVEFRTRAPDSSDRWVRAKGRVYRDAGGRPVRFDGVTLDVTHQKLLEREREQLLKAEREAREEAERAGRMKDEFIATLSHELRTPLSAILGWTYMLKRGGASVNVQKAAETIERNARAQAHLIDELLDVSRISSGNIRLELEPVAVSTVLEAVQQSLRPSAEAKKVRVEVDGHSAGTVLADPGRLQQIIWNIVANAIKFTPAGGLVDVRSEIAGAEVVLTISDTGTGIAAEFLPHVFERFRQAESSEARAYGGLGLGLAIVRQLVEMHGGQVDARSDGLGQGSRFIVRLPAWDPAGSPRDAAADTAAESQEPGHTLLAGRRVLVVDDEADGREMLAVMLRLHGAHVTTASSAEEALRSLQDHAPELLISDIGMPHVDGYELMRRIRGCDSDAFRRVPAIALTAFARAEDAAKARHAGFQMHMPKPVEPAALISSIMALARTTA